MVVLVAVVLRLELLEGLVQQQPRLELPKELEALRHLAHQPNPVRQTSQTRQVDELASERDDVDANGGVVYSQAKRYGSERRPAH